MSTIELTAAQSKNRVIGAGNKLLWRIPEDFAFFKKITMGSPVLMGRKTWESIGRPLPGRRNVVVTRNANYEAPGAELAASLDEALEKAAGAPRIFVIGGAEIYRQAMSKADVIWLTVLDENFEGDAFFPEIPVDDFSAETICSLDPTDARTYRVDFLRFDRKKQMKSGKRRQ